MCTLAYSGQLIWICLTTPSVTPEVPGSDPGHSKYFYLLLFKIFNFLSSFLNPDELAYIVRLASKLEGEKYKKRNRLVTPILSFVLFLFINVVCSTCTYTPYKKGFCVGSFLAFIVPFLVVLLQVS